MTPESSPEEKGAYLELLQRVLPSDVFDPIRRFLGDSPVRYTRAQMLSFMSGAPENKTALPDGGEATDPIVVCTPCADGPPALAKSGKDSPPPGSAETSKVRRPVFDTPQMIPVDTRGTGPADIVPLLVAAAALFSISIGLQRRSIRQRQSSSRRPPTLALRDSPKAQADSIRENV